VSPKRQTTPAAARLRGIYFTFGLFIPTSTHLLRIQRPSVSTQTWLPVAGVMKSTRVVSQTDTEDYGLCRQSWHVVYQKCKSRTLCPPEESWASREQQLCVDGCMASARQRPRPLDPDPAEMHNCRSHCIQPTPHKGQQTEETNRQISVDFR